MKIFPFACLLSSTVVALLMAPAAHASYPEMALREAYCNVEVRIGDAETPLHKLPTVHTGSTTKRLWIGKEGEQVCVRRETIPGMCTSPMQNEFKCVRGWTGMRSGYPVTSEN